MTAEKDSDFRLDGRVAVVTGSSSGIGKAIALELAAAGASIILHANRSEAAARDVRDTIRSEGGNAELELADIGDPASRRRLVTTCWDIHGPVDIWINNAGVDLLTGSGPGLSYEEKLEALLAVDVSGSILLSRDTGTRMKGRGRGCLLNIGWDQAATGMEGESGELFGAAKGAVMSFTRSLALSLAPEVRVNCIAPGWIRTAWGERADEHWQKRVSHETPLERWGTPTDVAKLARFLCSPAASYLTGQVFNANGGATR